MIVVAFLSSACGCQDNSGPGGNSRGAPGALTVAWTNPLASMSPGDNGWFGIPAVDNGQLYVADQNQIVALNAGSGVIRWSTAIKSFPNAASENIIVRGGLVISGDRDVRALDTATGALRWRFQTDSAPEAVAAADNDTYYTGQRSLAVIYSLTLSNGSLRWRTNAGEGWQYPAFVRGVSVSGDTVYAGIVRYLALNGYIRTGVVVALDRNTGRELWRYETPGQFHDVNWAPLVVGNLLVLDDLVGGGVYAIDRFNPGAGEKWRVKSPGQGAGPTIPSVVSDGRVYTATGGGYAYAIDAVTGRVVWQQQTKTLGLGVGMCRGSVYLNTTVLERRDANSGSQLGTANPKSGLGFTSDVISDGTRVFVTGVTGVTAVLCP
ncbi:MAG: PQQ-binding-like beta-propeller repeat protein [Gemmatimonadaceae bacterium]